MAGLATRIQVDDLTYKAHFVVDIMWRMTMRRIWVTAGIALCWSSGEAWGQVEAQKRRTDDELRESIVRACRQGDVKYRYTETTSNLSWISNTPAYKNTIYGGQLELGVAVLVGDDDYSVLFRSSYHAETWGFIDSINVNADGNKFSLKLHGVPSHDVLNGGMILEQPWFSITPLQLDAIANAEKATILITGSKFFHEATLDGVAKARTKTFIKIAAAIQEAKDANKDMWKLFGPSAMKSAENAIYEEDRAQREAAAAKRKREDDIKAARIISGLRATWSAAAPINGKPQTNWLKVEVSNPTDSQIEQVLIVLCDKDGEVGRAKINLIKPKSKKSVNVKVTRTKGLTAKVESIHVPQ